MILEALAWLCWSRLLLICAPFRWVAPHLGKQMAESPQHLSESGLAVAARVSWAVRTVAGQFPSSFVCLPQAMAAKWMLRRRRLSTTLYLGVRHGKARNMTAHAWLRAGNLILTGRKGMARHSVVATFGEEFGQ